MSDHSDSVTERQVIDGPDDQESLACQTCQAPIDPTEWHLVRARLDADDGFHLDSFCSRACRSRADAE